MSLRRMFEERSLRPIQDFLAIERTAPERVSKGGIIIPDSVADKHRAYTGKVVAIGPGRLDGNGVRKPITGVSVGDIVAFGRYSGAESALEDEDYWLVRYPEIHGVIEN